MTRYLLAAGTIALCVAASTSAGTAVHYDYWRYTLTGVQVVHWTVTDHFDRTDGEAPATSRITETRPSASGQAARSASAFAAARGCRWKCGAAGSGAGSCRSSARRSACTP